MNTPPRREAKHNDCLKNCVEIYFSCFYLQSKLEGASKEYSKEIDGHLLVKLSLGSQVRYLRLSPFTKYEMKIVLDRVFIFEGNVMALSVVKPDGLFGSFDCRELSPGIVQAARGQNRQVQGQRRE